MKIKELEINENTLNKNNLIINVLDIIYKISSVYENIDIKIFGPSEILVAINKNNKENIISDIIKVLIISILLFFGAALAITNFHEDVNMDESLKSIYYLITGENSENPLLIQIPYSLGLGVGMVTFFNHILKKKRKLEPSPLELEMHNYQKNIDEYILDITKHNGDRE